MKAAPDRMMRHIIKICPIVDEFDRKALLSGDENALLSSRKARLGDSIQYHTSDSQLVAIKCERDGDIEEKSFFQSKQEEISAPSRNALQKIDMNIGFQRAPEVEVGELARYTTVNGEDDVSNQRNNVVDKEYDCTIEPDNALHKKRPKECVQEAQNVLSKKRRTDAYVPRSLNVKTRTLAPFHLRMTSDKNNDQNGGSLLESLILACISENVSFDFLSNGHFCKALHDHFGVSRNLELSTHIKLFTQQLYSRVETSVRSIKSNGAFLTLVCSKELQNNSETFLKYVLMDEKGNNELVYFEPIANLEGASDTIQNITISVLNKRISGIAFSCQKAVHVCLRGFPVSFTNQLPCTQVPFSSVRFGGVCMIQHTNCLLRDTLYPAKGFASVLSIATQLALLTNDLRLSTDLRQSPVPLLMVPQPSKYGWFGYYLLLLQVQQSQADVLSKLHQSLSIDDDNLARQKIRSIQRKHEHFWQELHTYVEVLRPVAVADVLNHISTFQRCLKSEWDIVRNLDSRGLGTLSCGIYLCIDLWMYIVVHMCEHVNDEFKLGWKRVFWRRLKSEITEHHIAALVLDPRTRGVGLSGTGRRAARSCVMNIARRFCQSKGETLDIAEIVNQLSDYMSKKGIFADSSIWQEVFTMQPMAFWNDFSDAPQLQSVAQLVCGYVPYKPLSASFINTDLLWKGEDISKMEQIRYHISMKCELESDMLKYFDSLKNILGYLLSPHSSAHSEYAAPDISSLEQYCTGEVEVDDFEALAENYTSSFTKQLTAVDSMCAKIGYCENTEVNASADQQFCESWVDLTNLGLCNIADTFSSIYRYLSAFNLGG
ncbi:hypothetical protein ABG067_002815 [Albugo candida]